MSPTRAWLLVVSACGVASPRNPDAVPSLLAEIERIPIFDNHSHAPGAGEQEATRPPTGTFPATRFSYPFRLRYDSVELVDAWRALWKYEHDDADPAHLRELETKKLAERRELGDTYPAVMLERLGIETMIVVRELGRGQQAPRFLSVPFAGVLVMPEKVVADGLVPALPATLADYHRDVITASLAEAKQSGAVGIKLAIAYNRSLEFLPTDEADAAVVYARLVAGATLDDVEKRRLQDHLMFVVARECGRLGLVVNIHTGLGANPRFNITGSNPLLLERIVDHPDSHATKFVLVHGGWPFEAQAGAMLFKPNVYADISAHVFLQPPGVVADTLYRWLSFAPEKVLFGTDTFPSALFGDDVPLIDWEEKAWLTVRTGRSALATALQRMLDDRLVSREGALRIARMVLRDNARQLYGLDAP